MKLKRLLFVSSCLMLATAGIMAETPGTTTGTIGGGTTTPLKPKEPPKTGRPKTPSAQVVEAAATIGLGITRKMQNLQYALHTKIIIN